VRHTCPRHAHSLASQSTPRSAALAAWSSSTGRGGQRRTAGRRRCIWTGSHPPPCPGPRLNAAPGPAPSLPQATPTAEAERSAISATAVRHRQATSVWFRSAPPPPSFTPSGARVCASVFTKVKPNRPVLPPPPAMAGLAGVWLHAKRGHRTSIASFLRVADFASAPRSANPALLARCGRCRRRNRHAAATVRHCCRWAWSAAQSPPFSSRLGVARCPEHGGPHRATGGLVADEIAPPQLLPPSLRMASGTTRPTDSDSEWAGVHRSGDA
jgi:hypothetical protein